MANSGFPGPSELQDPKSKLLTKSPFPADADPLGSDDSLIDITEEESTNNNRLVLTDNADQANPKGHQSQSGTSAARQSQDIKFSPDTATEVSSHGSLIPDSEDGRNLRDGRIPSSAFGAHQDSRRQDAVISNNIQLPQNRTQTPAQQSQVPFLLGDPTFAGSFSSPTLGSPAGDWASGSTTSSRQYNRVPVSNPSSNTGTDRLGFGVGARRVDDGGWSNSNSTSGIHTRGDSESGDSPGSFPVGQLTDGLAPRRFNPFAPSTGSTLAVSRGATAAVTDSSDFEARGVPPFGNLSPFDLTSTNRSTTNEDQVDLISNAEDPNAKLYNQKGKSSRFSSSPHQHHGTSSSSTSSSMQGYENPNRLTTRLYADNQQRPGERDNGDDNKRSRSEGGACCDDQRITSSSDRGATNRQQQQQQQQPLSFQRNSYGEYSALPYSSFDIPRSSVYREAVNSHGGADAGAAADDEEEHLHQRHHHHHQHDHPHPHHDHHSSSGPGSAMTATFRHCHRANVSASLDKVAKRQLVAVVLLCLCFMIGEAIGGALSNSLALFTDVLHLGSDLISFIISLFALFLSNKGATKSMSFGYHRAEVLGALFSVFLIWLVSGVLCYIAVERIIQEHYKNVKPDEMLITASLGVVFNIVMAIVLHSEWCCKKAHSHSKFGHGHSHGGGGHGHSHGGHSKSYTGQESEYEPLRAAVDFDDDDEYVERHQEQEEMIGNGGNQHGRRKEVGNGVEGTHHDEEEGGHSHQPKNLNVRAAFIHVVGDIIQSLGVLVAALIIKFKPEEEYRLADPICTFLFSILVLITTIAVLRDTISIMMEAVPRDLSYESLKRDLLSLDGVVMVHSLHMWALTVSRNAVAVHLAVDDPRIHNQVLSSATYMIQTRHSFHYSTIQVELYDPEIMSTCQKCIELES